MGKSLIIPGADFSENGFRTKNIVSVILKDGGTNPYNVYLLLTPITISDSITTYPTPPQGSVLKSFAASGESNIESEYASLLIGGVAPANATQSISELFVDYRLSEIANANSLAFSLYADNVDFSGISFSNGVILDRAFAGASFGAYRMPKIYAASARYAFYNFGNQHTGVAHDLSFLKRATDLTSTFMYLKGASASFDGIDVSGAAAFNSTFRYCQLDEIDLSSWVFSSMTHAIYMFSDAVARTIHLDNWSKTLGSAYSSNMFASTPNLRTVFVTNCSSEAKTWLIGKLNEASAGGSSSWSESTVDGKAALVSGS